MSQVDSIRELGEKMYADGTVEVNQEDKTHANLNVPRETLVKTYEAAGLTTDQVDSFIKTTHVASRALYFAATKANTERVKEAVAAGEDYRGYTTTATCTYNRNFSLDAKVLAEKRGETRLRGEPQKYVKYNYGSGHVDMAAGMPSELATELSDTTRDTVKKSKYFEGDA